MLKKRIDLGMFSKILRNSIQQFNKSYVKYALTFPINNFTSYRLLSTSIDSFNESKKKVLTLKSEPNSEQKLKLYALFKQATEGKCDKPKPSMINFVEKAKWDAWNSMGDMKKDEAMEAYINLVNELINEIGIDNIETEKPKTSQSNVEESLDGLKVINRNSVRIIQLNRPQKKNAITIDMYNTWSDLLNQADKDPSVKVVLITGSGEYFCSGNDLSNLTNIGPNKSKEQMAKEGKEVLKRFVSSFIDFSKPLIGAINGPAIGVSVTTLGLYDAVYASDNATFSTPFTNLGQTPEGCSSYTFPRLLGPMKANSMVMFNKKLSANEAIGLVTQVFPHKVFTEEVYKIVDEIAEIPPQSLFYSKQLIRGPVKEKLHDVNREECDRLVERWLSEECFNAIMKFFSRKS